MIADFTNPEYWLAAGQILFRAGIAVILAALIGWERELHGRPAGVRTHMLVALGTVLFSEVGEAFAGDPARVAAQVVTGIGFLGAGTIMRMGGEVRGLTTAASIWATAAIAMAVSAGGAYLIVAVVATILALVTLALVDDLVRRFVTGPTRRRLYIVLEDRSAVHDLLDSLTKSGLAVLAVQILANEPDVEMEIQVEGRQTDILESLCALPKVKSATWSER